MTPDPANGCLGTPSREGVNVNWFSSPSNGGEKLKLKKKKKSDDLLKVTWLGPNSKSDQVLEVHIRYLLVTICNAINPITHSKYKKLFIKS